MLETRVSTKECVYLETRVSKTRVVMTVWLMEASSIFIGRNFHFNRNSTVLEVLWLLGMEGVAALDTRNGVYAKHCAWHEDGRLLTDGDSGLDASSKRFIGEQQSQVRHMEYSIMQWKTQSDHQFKCTHWSVSRPLPCSIKVNKNAPDASVGPLTASTNLVLETCVSKTSFSWL